MCIRFHIRAHRTSTIERVDSNVSTWWQQRFALHSFVGSSHSKIYQNCFREEKRLDATSRSFARIISFREYFHKKQNKITFFFIFLLFQIYTRYYNTIYTWRIYVYLVDPFVSMEGRKSKTALIEDRHRWQLFRMKTLFSVRQ